MSLDLPQLVPQLEAAGRSAAQRARALRARRSQADAALEHLGSQDLGALQRRVERAGLRWSGAVPTEEPPSAVFDPPDRAERYQLLAADGSHVYPDRHAAVFYYLINIGCIHLHPGSGEAPAVRSTPSLHVETDDLYAGPSGLSPTDLIDGRRDVAELGALADMASDLKGDRTLALLDNGLILWLLLQGKGQGQRPAEALLGEYLGHLERLRQGGAALAGIIDRPRHANVLDLAELAGGPAEEAEPPAKPNRGLTDAELFKARLGVGQRSALFIHGSPVNREFRALGHEIHFFYLRSGPEVVLRVEVPEWVAHRTDRLNLVHAGLLEDGRATGGFPYVLARAHELAVVSQPERSELDRMLTEAVLREGLAPSRSVKSVTKSWSGKRRRHRL